MECLLKMIEINKIMLVWIFYPGQEYCKVMMDIHRNMEVNILLEVVKTSISKQKQLSFMELIHKQILNNILSLKVQRKKNVKFSEN